MIRRLLRALFRRRSNGTTPPERELRERADKVAERAHAYAAELRENGLRANYRRADARLRR